MNINEIQQVLDDINAQLERRRQSALSFCDLATPLWRHGLFDNIDLEAALVAHCQYTKEQKAWLLEVRSYALEFRLLPFGEN